MKEIKVLGTGCAKCTKTIEVIAKIATELNVDVHVIKETDPEVIMGYGVIEPDQVPAVISSTIMTVVNQKTSFTLFSWSLLSIPKL